MVIGTIVAITSILGAPLGIFGAILMTRQSVRQAREQREGPLRAQVTSMTADRDYWRARADSLEAELRERDGRKQ